MSAAENEPSAAAIKFATGIYAEMFGHVSTDPADINRMVVIAIAFDSCAAASHYAVLAEREACAVIARAWGARQVAQAIAARGDATKMRITIVVERASEPLSDADLQRAAEACADVAEVSDAERGTLAGWAAPGLLWSYIVEEVKP